MTLLHINGVDIDCATRLCTLQPSRCSDLIGVPGSECHSCVWSPDGHYLAWSCGYHKVKIMSWNWLRRSIDVLPGQHTFETGEITVDAGCPVHSMTFCTSTSRIKHQYVRHISCRDLLLVTGLRNGRIRAWDVKTGILKLELCDHTATVTDLSFAPSGSMLLLSASKDGTLKFWDLDDDGNMIRTLRAKCTEFYGCRWSPDAQTIATVGNYRAVYLWDMKTYTIRLQLCGHLNTVTNCDFSPDGALLATSSYDSKVIVWDVQSGVSLFRLEHVSPPLSPIYAGGVNDYYVRTVSFSRNGRNLASVCDDGYVRIWELFASDPLVQVAPVSGALVSTYSPDGSLLAVGTSSGDLSIYLSPLPVPTLQHLCRMTIRRLLTRDAVDDLVCMPRPIRRFLQYDNHPVSASG